MWYSHDLLSRVSDVDEDSDSGSRRHRWAVGTANCRYIDKWWTRKIERTEVCDVKVVEGRLATRNTGEKELRRRKKERKKK